MSRPVCVLYTVYPHMGQHTGAEPFIRELRARGCAVDAIAVNDGDTDFPIRNARVRGRLRQMVQRRMPWYKLSDAAAEWRTGLRSFARGSEIVHYFDGEHS